MNNFQLLKAAQDVPHFRGVYLKNQLKDQKPKRNESGIINLDNNKGTHWTAYHKFGNVVIYFDSFGIQPPKEVINYFKPSNIFYFTDQIQNLKDSNCGQLCLQFLYNKKWSHLLLHLLGQNQN